MTKVYKPGKPPRKSNRPRITWLHVVYLVVAFSMVVSLVAGVFGGSALSSNQTIPVTGQASQSSAGLQIPAVITPIP